MSLRISLVSAFCLSAMTLGLSSCIPAVVIGGSTVGSAAVEEGGMGGAVDDSKIRLQISNALLKKDASLFQDVNLSIRGGHVMITGSVEKEESRAEAERIAEATEGVRMVYNELQVTNEGGILSYGNDVVISRSLKSRMVFDKNILSVNYDVDVTNGVVYILGIAQNEAERERVIAHARDVSDVKRVVAHIILKDDPSRFSAQ